LALWVPERRAPVKAAAMTPMSPGNAKHSTAVVRIDAKKRSNVGREYFPAAA